MLEMLNSRGKVGLAFAVVGVLLLLAGMIGYTMTGEVEDVPTPNAPNQAFFRGLGPELTSKSASPSLGSPGCS